MAHALKEAVALDTLGLIKSITPDNVPTGAKSVGSGTVKIFMSGEQNVYSEGTYELRDFLWENYQIEV